MRFNIRRSRDNQYYVTVTSAGNHEVILTSETYVSKASAQHAIRLIQGGAGGATVVDHT